MTSFPAVLNFLMLLLRTFFQGPGRPGCFSPTNFVIAARDEPLRSCEHDNQRPSAGTAAMSVLAIGLISAITGLIVGPHRVSEAILGP